MPASARPALVSASLAPPLGADTQNNRGRFRDEFSDALFGGVPAPLRHLLPESVGVDVEPAQAELAKQCVEPLFLPSTELPRTQAGNHARPPALGECDSTLLLRNVVASGNPSHFLRTRLRREFALADELRYPLDARGIRTSALLMFAAKEARVSTAVPAPSHPRCYSAPYRRNSASSWPGDTSPSWNSSRYRSLSSPPARIVQSPVPFSAFSKWWTPKGFAANRP